MTKTSFSKLFLPCACIVLIAAMALFTIGCGKTESKVTVTAPPLDESKTEETADGVIKRGEGSKSFELTVVDGDGNETKFLIFTDKVTVGEALFENSLLEGEESQYGLFVKKVNGITADYDADKTYWAFYINGEYAMTGVDKTDITEGDLYMLKVEK